MEKLFFSVAEVAELLGISKSKAYAIIRSLNEELEQQGFITFSGKISKKYFQEKVYGMQ